METTLALSHLLLFVLAFHSGESIKCYVCTSATDSKCADPITADTALQPVECTPSILSQAGSAFNEISKGLSDVFGLPSKNVEINTELVCSKIDFDADNKKVTTRGCAPSPKTLDYCKKLQETPSASKMSFCETCDKDLCNGAGTLHAFMLLVLPAVFLLFANS